MEALAAVGKGMANLGVPDPRLQVNGRLHPLLDAFKKGMQRTDSPSVRAYPANITILQALPEVLDVDHARLGTLQTHTILLIIVAFFWLLRPGEYAYSTDAEDSRSQAFLLRDVQFTIDGRIYNALDAPLNDESDVSRIEYASLTFSDQKNAVKGEQIGHLPTADPYFCPAKALGRLVLHLRHYNAEPTTPFYHHYNEADSSWHRVRSTFITNALRHAATHVSDNTGIDPKMISARSLRPGGATALLCANVDSDAIMLLGRWKSDAMLRCLRIQAKSHRFGQLMLEHGAYTFHPQAIPEDDLPIQAPPAVAQLYQAQLEALNA